MHSFDGANCVRNDQGGLVSPWTGFRWSCAGTYDGVPFSLYDWFARINSAESMRCAFAIHLKGQDPSGCPSVLIYP